MPKPLIKAINLKREFTTEDITTSVLLGINLEIHQGEFVAIMGPSGSGKSTLMHLLGFLDRPSSGQYIFRGEDTADFNDDQLAVIRNREIGFVFQAFFLLPKTTVLENVKLPLIYSHGPVDENKAKEALKAVGLAHRLGHFSSQLSGGEKQRVVIARALVNDPEIVFADEPTGNLDSKSGAQVMEILSNLNKSGKTIILVTHEKETAHHAQRIVQIKDGQIVDDYRV